MDLRNSVLPSGNGILKYCFKPSKVGEKGVLTALQMHEQVPVIYLIYPNSVSHKYVTSYIIRKIFNRPSGRGETGTIF